MTEEKQEPQKQKPAFYIFKKNSEGVSEKVGAAFKHTKGNGLNIVIDETRYAAFPPKVNSPE